MLGYYISVFKQNGFKFNTVYDVGACDGYGSVQFKSRVLHDAEFILFEANPAHEQALKKTGFRYFNKVLSNPGRGAVEFFSVKNTGDSYYKENSAYYDNTGSVILQTVTLDQLIEEHTLPIPQLLKIDTQGSELDILSGATKILGKTEMIMTELPIIEYNKGAPNISDYLAFFKNHDYIPVDITEIHRAEYTLLQLDILFVLREAKNKYLSPNIQIRV